MIKCILCDLDETLLDENKQIPLVNIQAIQKAKKQGVKFVCATGRHIFGITNILKTLELYNCENEYVVALNGALLVECKENRCLASTTFSGQIGKKIVAFALKHDLCVELYTPKGIYIYNLNEDERKRVERSKLPFTEIMDGNCDYLDEEDVLKIALESSNYPYLLSLKDEVDFLEEEVQFTYSSNRYMEFNSVHTSKGLALKNLAKHLNISIEETMAIGDHFNDVSMLEVAGLSVAVSNAQEEVKKICDVTTSLNHCEGGVAEAIYNYVLGGSKDE